MKSETINTIHIQVLFWLLLFASFFVVGLHSNTNLSFNFIKAFSTIGFLIPVFYFSAIKMGNEYLKSKNIKKVLLNSLLFILLITIIRCLYDYFFIAIYFKQHFYTLSPYHSLYVFITETIAAITGFLFYFTILYTQDQLKAEKNKRTQIEVELETLKFYLQPHFIFNNLNNLYGLATAKSDQLESYINSFSEVMRYFTDIISRPSAGILQEMEFIHHFINLEKLKRSKLIVNISVNITNDRIQIPTMILIPLIENCFKHVDPNTPTINIELSLKDQFLCLKCSNTAQTMNISKRPGTGINNLRTRLKQLFKQNYQLSSFTEKGQYFSLLKIPIYD